MTDFASRISRGNLFHKRGAATTNDEWPYFLFDRGPGCNNFVLLNLSVCWCFSQCNKSLRYEEVPMNSALYVRTFSLNLIRDLIGNQCTDLSRGLDSESLLDLVTTHARQFCTRCKLVLYFSEQLNSNELQ